MKANRNGWRAKARVWITFCISAPLAMSVCAQDKGAMPAQRPVPVARAAQSTEIQEVIVTAQRRKERMQDVPLSVSAFSGEQLKDIGVSSVKDLAAVAPGMWVGQGLSDPTDIAIGVRGLALSISQLVVDPSVGLYIDGVYFSRSTGSNVGFVDMERVEVLRGPQGTLFGRNTIGGAVSVTTNKPTDALEGSVAVDLGNYGTRNITGILNVPLVKGVVDARLAYQHAQHDGYSWNRHLNEPLDDLKQDYLRGSVLIKPDKDWEILLAGDVQRAEGHSQMSKLGYVRPGPFDAAIPAANGGAGDLISNYVGGDFHTNDGGFNPPYSSEGASGTATVTGKLSDGLTVKSITGYRAQTASRPADLAGTPYPYFNVKTKPFWYHQVSQELQGYGDLLDKRLSWIAGLYYFTEDGRQGQQSDALVGVQTGAGIGDYSASNQSRGGFVQGTYELLPKLKLTAGIRYTKDARQVRYFDRRFTFATGAETCAVAPVVRDAPNLCQASSPATTFSYKPATLGLDYKLDANSLLYLKVSKGYRSGGYSAASPSSPVAFQPFMPESLLSREVGTKLDLLNRKLRINAALYSSTYNEMQQTVNMAGPLGVPVAITANVGRSTINGGELEVIAKIDRLRLNASVGIVDAKYTHGPLVGTPYLNAPRTTRTIGAYYPVYLANNTVTVNANYLYQSRAVFFSPIPGNHAASDALTQSGYGLLNGRITWERDNSPITYSLWGMNLTDRDYKVRAEDFVSAGLGIIPFQVGAPRTFGVTATYSF